MEVIIEVPKGNVKKGPSLSKGKCNKFLRLTFGSSEVKTLNNKDTAAFDCCNGSIEVPEGNVKKGPPLGRGKCNKFLRLTFGSYRFGCV